MAWGADGKQGRQKGWAGRRRTGRRLTAALLPGLLCLLCLAAGWTGPASAQMPNAVVIDARFGLHPTATRFVLEVDRQVPFRILSLSDPARLIIDFFGLEWASAPRQQPGKGLVAGVDVERFTSQTLRVVLTLARPAKLREVQMLPAEQDHMPRFVLDVTPAERGEFDRSLGQILAAWPGGDLLTGRQSGAAPHDLPPGAAAALRPRAAEPPPSAPVAPVAPVAAPPPGPPAMQVAAAGVVPPVLPKAKPMAPKRVVVLDAGHGGDDPGAIGVGGVHEKDVTLNVARILRRHLLATGRYEVVLTRDRDVFIRLRERVAIARKANADLFVSLHADSIGMENFRGASVYTLSDTASDREAEMLAAKENRVDALGGVDLSNVNELVASILIDLAQRDTMNQSRRFAGLLIRDLGQVVELIPRPQRSAGFAVLTAADVPSVLIEMGYLSSAGDALLLTQPAHVDKLTGAIQHAVDAYFEWLLAGQGL